MRHDEERPRTNRFLSEGTVPGHWTQVLGGMRANPFTRLSLDDVLTKAAHVLILSPTLDVARACFGELLAAADPDSPGSPRITITALDDFVASDVPAGTWIFLPHRQDGWTELEAASAKLRSALVKENSTRETGSKLVLMEYGINLWMWADPPSSGGDPVCHAGELISWESAWALGLSDVAVTNSSSHPTPAVGHDGPVASARPPIYFGLPPILRKRRWES